MAWSLAFSHLCNYILKDPNKLAGFNQTLRNKHKGATPIATYDDFSRVKEYVILDLCNEAKIFSKNHYTI
jgi:hypothetical protein